MKQRYIILMLAVSTHLFGAAAAGNTPQERFNNALQSGTVDVIVAAFVDLDPADRRETTNNYQRFAHFIRYHRPAEDSAAYARIIDLYRSITNLLNAGFSWVTVHHLMISWQHLLLMMQNRTTYV